MSQLAEVEGKNPATLRTHINRGYVVAVGPRNKGGDKEADKPSRFSFFTMMQFALAYELADLGVQTKLRSSWRLTLLMLEVAVKYLDCQWANLPCHIISTMAKRSFAMTPERTFEEQHLSKSPYLDP